MPRCFVDEAEVRSRHLRAQASPRAALRMARMRSRMPASSCSHRRAQFRRFEHRGHDLAAVRRRIGVVGPHDALQLAQHARGFVGAVCRPRSARRPARRTAKTTSRTSSRRTTVRRLRRTRARPTRRGRCRRRSPGRRDRGTGIRPRFATVAITASHCAGDRSTPVGLWQQACSTTIEPAGMRSRAASIASKSTPCVAAS